MNLTNLAPADRRTLEQAKRDRQTIRDLFQDVDDGILSDLMRRAQHDAVDAYTQGTGGRGNDTPDPTYSNVLRAAGSGEGADTWPFTPDHVRQVIVGMFAQLHEMAKIAEHVGKGRVFVYAIADKAAGRKTSLGGPCERCDTNVTGAVGDKLVSGYCGKCRKAWERAGYPDRHQFERSYQQEQAAS